MVDSQLVGEEIRGVELRDVGTETQKGSTEPVPQTQTTPSPSSAFVKENIDVLRTIISGIGEKEFLGNFYLEIPEQRFRSSCRSMLPKGTRK
ncbi:hypothetical protein Tco_1159289 [Tanacetum coccineum]